MTQNSEPFVTSKKKILVVEDEGLIATDIRNQLERCGYHVPATASSGEEALRLARLIAFDLAILDIRLKGDMDGIALAQVLRGEFGLPAIYLTAYSDKDTLDRAQFTSPFGFLVKPFGEATLRSTVQMSLYRRELELRSTDSAMPPDSFPVRLTAREREVVRLVAEGFTAKEIGEAIHLAPKTVEFHKYNVMKKASARGTADLTRFAIKLGIARL